MRNSVSALLLSLAAAASSAQNLIVNPSLEDLYALPNFGGLRFTGYVSSGDVFVASDPLVINNVYFNTTDGSWAAMIGRFGGSGSLTQTVATSVGEAYTLEFDLMSYWNSYDRYGPTDGAVYFGGRKVIDLNDLGYLPFTRYSLSVVGSGSDELRFSFDGKNISTVALDNLSLAPQAVPEPASLAALSLGAMAVLRRRRA